MIFFITASRHHFFDQTPSLIFSILMDFRANGPFFASLRHKIQGVFYEFTTLILYHSKSLTSFFTNSQGILELLVCLQENLIQFDGEA